MISANDGLISDKILWLFIDLKKLINLNLEIYAKGYKNKDEEYKGFAALSFN